MVRKHYRMILTVALLALLSGALPLSAKDTQNKEKKAEANMPKVGAAAPDFKLQYFDGTDLKDVSLDQYRGKKNIVLAFYIFAFTGG